MTNDLPVTEDELHAYVDGELPSERSEAVTAWLAAHPDQATQVAAWRAQADSIRARYAGIAQEPLPDRLNLETLMRDGRSINRRWASSWSAAGCCLDRPAQPWPSICTKENPASALPSTAPRRPRRKARCATRTRIASLRSIGWTTRSPMS